MAAEMDIRLHVLEKITKNFSVDLRIGKGGYGNVYKGVLCDQELIAVKLLHDSVERLDDELFKNEVGNLLTVEHPNIVQFLGYCYETRSKYVKYNGQNRFSKHIHRVLCFEYLQGGSLDKRLHEQSLGPTWSTHYNIIKGICEGLNFLHGHEPQILHLDLKPANILLDSNMTPKVADFGLSRLFGGSHTHVTRKMIGTEKYMSPDSINECIISPKNDIFSLGVVIIEIMAGPSGYSDFQEDIPKFIHEVLNKWSNIIEPTMEYRPQLLLQVKTCIDTAMRCVDSQRENRPTIASILDIFNEIETDIPNTQLAVMPPSRTIDIKNSLAETLKKMTADPDNITNSVANMEHVPKIREASSNVEEPSIIEKTEHRETSSYVEEGLIIGRNEEKNKILSILSESSTKEMVILPIYGIGGIGKTTLAQLVYNDTQFNGYSRVWIYVSEKFDLKKIGNSIISLLRNQTSIIDNMEMLNKQLANVLVGKSILIVLDDLWENDPAELDKLKAMLKLGHGSKVILVTTRDEEIARNICSTVNNVPYKLDNLTDDMCWTIIKQKTKFENQADKRNLEQIGKDIAIKCGGVALAAQSIGYLLMSRCTSDQWESVRKSDIWYSEDASLGTHKVLASLRLSYSHMSRWLKSCFSYYGVFQKGHSIAKNDLIHQWIALGFPQPSEVFDPMQICEQYVIQLLGMSFLQYSNTQLDYLGRKEVYTYFTMHDLVHDLARATLAGKVNKKENVAGSSCQYALLTDPSMPLQSSLNSPENLKALHFLNCRRIKFSEGAISPAKCLHVLDLRGCGILELPDSIGQLKQLRYLYARCSMIPDCITKLSKLNYLSLRHSEIEALPDSIGDIRGLMHLDLYQCDSIRELPVSFAELKQLVHLNLSFCSLQDNMLPEVIGKLPKLKYLMMSACCRSNIQSLLVAVSTLHNLEHLHMSYIKELVNIPESFGDLKKLQILDLSHYNGITELPSWMNKMVSLKIVDMTHYVLKMSKLECSSNLVLFGAIYPDILEISELENVMSLEEAQSIELIVKRSVRYLKLEWTVDCDTKHVDDKDVLEKLVARKNVAELHVTGYRSLSFPTNWQMGIEQYLPNVHWITLENLPKCSNLPPLGQLPNLRLLHLHRMDSLEELNTADSCGELLFPELGSLHISSCPKLRIKPCLPRSVKQLSIKASDNMLISLAESVRQTGASSISLLSVLDVGKCTVPLHQWEFLQHVSALRELTIRDCNDLASFSSPEVIQRLSSLELLDLHDSVLAELPTWLGQLTSLEELRIRLPKLEKLNDNISQLTRLLSLDLIKCRSMTSLPQWLGELTSLEKLTVSDCKGIRSLPGSIRQLTELSYLTFDDYEMDVDKIREMFSSIPAGMDEINMPEFIREYIDPEYLLEEDSIESTDSEEDSIESTDSEEDSIESTDSEEDSIESTDSEEDSIESTDSEEDIEEHEEGIVEQDEDIEKHEEDVNNSATRADAHGDPGMNTAAVADADAAALVLSPSAALYIEFGSAAKKLSDPPAEAVNTSTQEKGTHKRRVGEAGSADPVIVEAPGRAEKRPRLLVPEDPDASAATTDSQDTSRGSRINNNGTTPDAAIMPADVVADAAATDIVPSLSSLASEPDLAPWWKCYLS